MHQAHLPERGARRAGEGEGIYVDRYTAGELALALGLVALSLLDLALTLRHLAAGGEEANPLMAWALAGGGTLGFALLKTAATVGATLVLLLHVRFPLARRALPALVTLYVGVLCWHGVVEIDRLVA